MTRPAMTDDEIEATIERLVATRYPHEISEIMAELQERSARDRDTIVGAALARSVQKGRDEGVKAAQDVIRKRLGL